jgi:predicted DCC family thiol-disulfide oxidoreductase YuxK
MSNQTKLKPGSNIIFYDGVCGLCNKLVQFVLKHDRSSKFLFCALQSEIAKQLLSEYGENNTDLNTVFVLSDYHLSSSQLLKKSTAVFFILRQCNLPWYSPWCWLCIFNILPDFLLNIGYDLVARYRYKIFGHYDSCLLPNQAVRDKFIDL